jgi:hypothetical protein
MAYNKSLRNMAYNNSLKLSSTEEAILITILYSDVFNFPLTKDELWKLLISKKKITKNQFNTHIISLLQKKVLVVLDGFYCLSSKKSSIEKRKNMRVEVQKKLLLAHKAAAVLSAIPSILFIGISGGLAVGNATESDDIDFFIIVRKNTLFVSRMWILLLLEVMGIRRTRTKKNTANKICVNLLLDETALAWPKTKRDVYVAREIAQIVPLYERKTMYKRFLTSNTWINSFLPNAFALLSKQAVRSSVTLYAFQLVSFILRILPFEIFFRMFQITLIKRHQTREIITKNQLAFHPKDYGSQTIRELRLKMRQFGLLTKF